MTERVVVQPNDSGRRPANLEAANGSRAWLRPGIGLLLAAVFIGLMFHHLPLSEVQAQLALVNWRVLPLALLFLAIGYTARITRWLLMLRTGAPQLRWGEAARPFLVSIAVNNVLPLRAGDVLRLFAFRGRPGGGPSRVAGTLIVERILDLLVLLLIFAVVLPALPQSSEVAALSWIALPAGLVAVAGLSVLFCMAALRRLILVPLAANPYVRRSSLTTKVIAAAMTLAVTLAELNQPGLLARLVVLSLCVWLFEGGVFVVAAAASDVSGGLAASFLALAIATLSTLLPSSPGYVGTFHFFASKAALIFGTAPPTAAAFAIVAHLLLWLPTTTAGALVLLWSSLRAGRRPAEPQIESADELL